MNTYLHGCKTVVYTRARQAVVSLNPGAAAFVVCGQAHDDHQAPARRTWTQRRHPSRPLAGEPCLGGHHVNAGLPRGKSETRSPRVDPRRQPSPRSPLSERAREGMQIADLLVAAIAGALMWLIGYHAGRSVGATDEALRWSRLLDGRNEEGETVDEERVEKDLLRIEFAAAFGLDPKSEQVQTGVATLYARGYRPEPSWLDPRNVVLR